MTVICEIFYVVSLNVVRTNVLRDSGWKKDAVRLETEEIYYDVVHVHNCFLTCRL